MTSLPWVKKKKTETPLPTLDSDVPYDSFDPEAYLENITVLRKQLGLTNMPVPSAPHPIESVPRFEHILSQAPSDKVSVEQNTIHPNDPDPTPTPQVESTPVEPVSWSTEEPVLAKMGKIYDADPLVAPSSVEKQSIADLRSKLGISLPDDSLQEIHNQLYANANSDADKQAAQYDKEQAALDTSSTIQDVDFTKEVDLDLHETASTKQTTPKQDKETAILPPELSSKDKQDFFAADKESTSSTSFEETLDPVHEVPMVTPEPLTSPQKISESASVPELLSESESVSELSVEPEVTSPAVSSAVKEDSLNLQPELPVEVDDETTLTPEDSGKSIQEKIEEHIVAIETELHHIDEGEELEREKLRHLKEGVLRCKELMHTADIDQIKNYYNKLSIIFNSLDQDEIERQKWFGVLQKLYADILKQSET